MLAESEVERESTVSAADIHTIFAWLLSKGKSSSGIGSFVQLVKDHDKKFAVALTPDGEALHRTFEQASRLAEEKGLGDRDVLAFLGDVESKWPSHPGIVENAINEAIERSAAGNAVEIAERAVADWMATISKS